MRIVLDRLADQIKCREYVASFPSVSVRESTQEQIVRGQVARWPFRGSADLSNLLCRLGHPGNADSDFVLKVEDIFQRAVKTVSPGMRIAERLDQLSGDVHPASTLSYRAFEDIAYAQFATDLLYVDGLALVGKARITGDDEEPSYPGERSDDLLDHAIGEIFLLGVPAHILERQNRNRRLVG